MKVLQSSRLLSGGKRVQFKVLFCAESLPDPENTVDIQK